MPCTHSDPVAILCQWYLWERYYGKESYGGTTCHNLCKSMWWNISTALLFICKSSRSERRDIQLGTAIHWLQPTRCSRVTAISIGWTFRGSQTTRRSRYTLWLRQ